MTTFRAPQPAHLPHLSYILDDLHANSDQVARYLDISPATLARYAKSGGAPRPVHLALFWETRWGISLHDSLLYNTAQVHRQHAKSLQEHLGDMAGAIMTLESEIDRLARQDRPARVAANAPVYRVA